MSALPWLVMGAASLAADYTNPIPQPGEAGYAAQPKHHLRVQFENDSAVARDEKYTHGSRLDYVQETPKGMNAGFSLTQNIYTPSTHTHHANPGEHPYAGLLAAGGVLQAVGTRVGGTTELQLGVMGKHSRAKEAQNNLHEFCALETWKGWQDQVPSEAVLQSSSRIDFDVPLHTEQADALVFLREELGNARIASSVGTALRVGKNLPQNNQVIGSRASQVGTGALLRKDYDPTAPSYYLLAQAEFGYVARDFSVDGGMFHHFNQTCSRVPWQGQMTLGLGMARKGIDYFAGLVYNTKTYRSEKEEHLYGTFSVQWNW